MEKILEYIVKNLVKNSEDVKVEKTENETEILLNVFVNDDDKGRVIGKEGKIINSLRIIMKSITGKTNSCKSNKKIVIKIN